MPTTRRQFIKRGAAMAGVSFLLPEILFKGAHGQTTADPNRRILVVIQLEGGNDGLNTVVPYTNDRYFSLRPVLGIRESELQDAQGKSTIITNKLGFHPVMSGIKDLYDKGRVAVVLGAGDGPNPGLSHFIAQDIWQVANVAGDNSEGWLGKLADQGLAQGAGVRVLSSDDRSPRALVSKKAIFPNVPSFAAYNFQTDAKYPGNGRRQIGTFNAYNSESFPPHSFLAAAAEIGLDAVQQADRIGAVPSTYQSSVTYPANNPLAARLKMVAQIIIAIPEVEILYVRLGGFDHHAAQGVAGNKRIGQHATLLQYFSDGVKAFYDDMVAHGLADNVLLLQWSEFGRRPNENGSLGTDHGAGSLMFVMGNPVRGGLYGQQSSLAPGDVDSDGNPRTVVDFRAVYATVIEKWLGGDSQLVLGKQFENVGFLG
jgi:uncharacterized protein (DUF1501 family)